MQPQPAIREKLEAHNQYELLGGILRSYLKQDRVVHLDLSYLGVEIDRLWNQTALKEGINVSHLYLFIQERLHQEHLKQIQSVGEAEGQIAAVIMSHCFNIPDRTLAHLVHEALARIGGMIDIKYPYEDHKELSPKQSGHHTSDWGRGLGVIRPHSDDLYEKRDINLMCLTVCKDTSCTPTRIWKVADIVNAISDYELGLLAASKATFVSGTNVNGRVIRSEKPILRQDSIEGVGLRLDFRTDDTNGPRMKAETEEAQAVIDKLKEGLKNQKPLYLSPQTGSSILIANFKAIHGRSPLNAEMLYEGPQSRILFRSKGLKLTGGRCAN